MSRMWRRAPADTLCGGCRNRTIERGEPAIYIKVNPQVTRELIRCQNCAGEAAPELPELMEAGGIETSGFYGDRSARSETSHARRVEGIRKRMDTVSRRGRLKMERPCEITNCPALALRHQKTCKQHENARTAKDLHLAKDASGRGAKRCLGCRRAFVESDYVIATAERRVKLKRAAISLAIGTSRASRRRRSSPRKHSRNP